jgi:spore coat polysaccharide biosynthesis protein SpsF
MSGLRVVLQARTSSTRLPAKALLPIAGMPSAILAARRAARDGLDLVFATSSDPTDDLLAALAANAGLKVFRGSKDDVLGRYVAAAEDMADEDVVLRITGDDPVPDADFLRGVAAARARLDLDMLFSISPLDGCPHGLAAQAFTAGALRRAAAAATAPFDREHAGPWLVRNCSSAAYADLAGLDAGHLRCTLDTIDDYFDLVRLFDGVADPIGAPWRDLIEKLRAQSPWSGMPFRYLRGLPGGDATAERLGAVVPDADAFDGLDDDSAVATLRQAIRCGASHIAASPGHGARLLGVALGQGWNGRANAILRLTTPPAEIGRGHLMDWADTAILGALRQLGLPHVHTLSFAPPAGARGVTLCDHLELRQAEGWFRHLGVTVDTPAAAKHWLKREIVTHVELDCGPDNFAAPGLAAALDARPEAMMLARPVGAAPLDALLRGALMQGWPQGAVIGIASAARLTELVDTARAARPRKA